MDIADRNFLVTGAGSGLGAAVAEMIVAEGGRAALLDVNETAGRQMQEKLGQAAIFCRTDVSSEADGRAAIAAAAEAFGGIDGLVSCAGIAPGERMLGRDGPHSLETFSRTVTVNLIGTFNMMRLAAEAIASREAGRSGERGVIVNTASVAAYEGQIGQAAYAASKGGVAAMTLPVARDLARHGIRVVAVAPGIFKTPMVSGLPQDVQDSLGASVPFPARLGEPAEFASLVREVIRNQMLNGEVIRLDGAIRMAPR